MDLTIVLGELGVKIFEEAGPDILLHLNATILPSESDDAVASSIVLSFGKVIC